MVTQRALESVVAIHQTEAAKNFLRADNRRGDLGHRQPLLRRLLADQLIGLRLANLLEGDENLDGLIDVPPRLQRFLEFLNLALEATRIAMGRARKYER